MTSSSLSPFHAALLEFLMTAKQGLIAVGKEYDLTPIQAMTLALVDKDNPKPMNSFQKLYNCDASNITGIIDGLEEKKLALRGEHPEDRRVKTILLTDEGVVVQGRLIDSFTEIDHMILGNLTEAELASFKSIIIKLAVQNK
ncbi:MAG: transcriptional regulator, MarR family [Candidatus Saccharibacteria bacterium]|nr:transcriptional regulator, MarR family [Candidatus Saccharibacteria bacterium]